MSEACVDFEMATLPDGDAGSGGTRPGTPPAGEDGMPGPGDETRDLGGDGDDSDLPDPESADDNNGADDAPECAPAQCTAYAAKMMRCYPINPTDWYQTCLEVYDICDIAGGCWDQPPEIISCSIAMPCDAVINGECLDGQSC